MPITLTCRCGKRLRAGEHSAGKKIACPACGANMEVPPEAMTGDEADFDDERRIIQEFRRKQVIQIAFIPIAIVALMLFAFAANEDKWRGFPMGRMLLDVGLTAPVMAVIGLVAIIAMAVISVFNWRCPSCKKYLGRQLFVVCCPKCSVPFKPPLDREH